MDSLELFTGIVAIVVGARVWAAWYGMVLNRDVPRLSLWSITCLAALPLLSAGLIALVLLRWASADVRSSGFYVGYYIVLGLGWLAGVTKVFSLLGLSAREDVVGRRNETAAPAVGGALLGATLCFAGANVGNGPGVEVVLVSAVAATAIFLLCWVAAESLNRPSLIERITVERDLGASWRLAGFLTGVGLILGRSVAGDWISAEEFGESLIRIGWPVLPGVALVVAVERVLRDKEGVGAHASAVLGFIYFAGALAYIVIWHRQF